MNVKKLLIKIGYSFALNSLKESFSYNFMYMYRTFDIVRIKIKDNYRHSFKLFVWLQLVSFGNSYAVNYIRTSNERKFSQES